MHKSIETKRTLRPAGADFHRSFADKLHPYMLFSVGQNVENVWNLLLDEEWIQMFLFPPSFPKTDEVDNYSHVTPFLDAAQLPHDLRSNRFFE